MDARTFDALVRTLTTTGSRRGLLGFLATLPLVGGLVALLDHDEADAKGRRKRHKKPHHHRKHTGNHKGNHQKRHKHKKRCRAESPAETCADRCGSVENNCQQTVDCGSCACDPPCAICQTCDESTGTCVANAEVVGDACATCHTCDAAGACVSVTDGTACDDDNACTQVDTCQGGVCIGGDPVVCQPLDQCHIAGTCDPDTGLCSNPPKTDGTPCDNPCTTGGTCAAGVCAGAADPAKRHVCGVCANSDQWCDAGACADIQDTVTFPDCQSLCSGSTDVCGQTVTCPSCDLCAVQTGCNSNTLQDGPVGPGRYCSVGGSVDCTTNDECTDDAPFSYCTVFAHVCALICPF